MKIKKRFLFPSIILLGILIGPRPDYEEFDGKIIPLNIPLEKLDTYIGEKEKNIIQLKPDNEARIVWADSIRKTPYSIVYLHGWSASQEEGDPIHEEFTKRYGCNLYLSRLAGHGIDDKDAFLDITPKQVVESAKEAVAIGQLIGEKVILLSCSTGGTLSIYLTSENPELIHSQILFSPNIDIYDPMSELLTAPWGKQLAKKIVGDYHSFTPPEEGYKYWTTTYRTEGLICLKYLVEKTMKPSVWKKIDQPLFMGFYYKNEEEQDQVVSVEEMHRFFKNISTAETQKRSVAFPTTENHIMISRIHSKDLDTVRQELYAFAEEVLGLVPKQ